MLHWLQLKLGAVWSIGCAVAEEFFKLLPGRILLQRLELFLVLMCVLPCAAAGHRPDCRLLSCTAACSVAVTSTCGLCWGTNQKVTFSVQLLLLCTAFKRL